MDILILIISFYLLYKKRLAWVLFGIILLTTNYLAAGTNLSEFPFLHNVSDSGLILYLFLSFSLLKKHNYKLPKTTLRKYIIIFFVFLIISILVDLIFNGIDLLSIIKTSRHWIFLSCIWIFYYIPEKEVKELIKYLLNALAIISIIMLIEFIFNVQVLGKDTKTEYLTPGYLITRGSIPSVLIMFFLLLLFSQYFKFKVKIKYFYILLFSAVLITSMIRSWLFAMVIGIILVLNLHGKLRFNNLLKGIIIAASLILIVSTNPIIQERFRTGIEEIQYFKITDNVQGNLSFRILQTVERLNYITQSLQYSIFGIGNITDENFPNIFYIGLKYESGRVMQLNTPDIAWLLLFIRLGLLGTFVYLIFYTIVLIKFYRIRVSNPLAIATFAYLFINLTLISFASWDIAYGEFWLLPILLYYSAFKKTSNVLVK